jgi:nucleotide-binding universal stress UspA family protein
MKRFKHILATTDLSSESFAAVSYAGHLARDQGAKLSVLYVPHSSTLLFSEFAPTPDLALLDSQIEEMAEERLSAWVKRHLRHLDKVNVVVRRGETHSTICKVADELKASVIVIATHGRKGFGHAMLGSVAERVIRDAPCPVLVIKPPKPAVRKKTS